MFIPPDGGTLHQRQSRQAPEKPPQTADPESLTPQSLPVSPSVTPEGRSRATLSGAEDTMKPASHVNTAQRLPYLISGLRDRGSEKVSIPEVAQLGRSKGLWEAKSSACLSYHSPCLLQRHLIVRRECACKFSTSNQSQGPGPSVVARGTNYAPARASGPGLGTWSTAAMMTRTRGATKPSISCTPQAGLWQAGQQSGEALSPGVGQPWVRIYLPFAESTQP